MDKESEGGSSHNLQDVVQIRYEWESELEEYDEPDIYPSEKDYQWVEETIEVDDSEDQHEAEQKEEVVDIKEEPEAEDKKEETAEEGAKPEEKTEEAKPEEDEKSKKEEGKPDETKKEPLEDEKDEDEEQFEKTSLNVEEEEEEKASDVPKKKLKTVLVKKLIERPPKIHYDPEEERIAGESSDEQFFHSPPFKLLHSFGYDCQRMANLHVLDDSILIFMSGYVLTFFNHRTGEKSYLRCLGGSCFGALAIHPSKKLFAAAEKGNLPLVGIWSWPKLQLFRKLREGTNHSYASVIFSPDGALLASQGGEPDYLITVWNWLKEIPVLRVKSHAQDVYRVTFSKELAGNLTTSGLCHIKFWKMASTFTGLKLKGDIGRFGRTELSDIEGYVEMPDGKVVSGCEWGNLLVWENGLIIAEICSHIDVPCHDGIVRQVFLHDGDFYTTGQDGFIKTWNFDAIDTAEIQTTEESLKVPLKVMSQIHVHENSDLWYLVQDIPDPSTLSVFWFAQDGGGKIWKVDLSFLNTAKDPMIMLSAHGGAINDCKACDLDYLVATIGEDGTVRVYNYLSKTCVAMYACNAPGTCLLWPDTRLDRSAYTLIAGFADGVIRVFKLSSLQTNKSYPMSLVLEVVKKPHDERITSMALDSDAEYFVTGSLDGTIFFFHARDKFKPMVYIEMENRLPVRDVQWSKSAAQNMFSRVLVTIGCDLIQEIEMPLWAQINNETTFLFKEASFLRSYEFYSIKSVLIHNEELEKERAEEEKKQALIQEHNLKLIEDGIETQSQQDIRLLVEAEENDKRAKEEAEKRKEWVPYIPTEPSPILQMIQSPLKEDEFLLSMGKYDAGYIYVAYLKYDDDKTSSDADKPMNAISCGDDVPITHITVARNHSALYMGTEDGRIRIQTLEETMDYESWGPSWTEGVHDCVRGRVTAICEDKDSCFLFTCGADGNFFMHSLKEDLSHLDNLALGNIPKLRQSEDVHDIVLPDAFTLEVAKTAEKRLELLAAAKRNKTLKREEISRLRAWFVELVRKNLELPPEMRLTPVEFVMSHDNEERLAIHISEALETLRLETAWETERCNIALKKLKTYYRDPVQDDIFKLFAFNSSLVVNSFRVNALPKFFEEAKDKVMNQVTPKRLDSDIYDDEGSDQDMTDGDAEPKPVHERWMSKFDYLRAVRLWKRRMKRFHRKQQWKLFLASEPTDRELHEEDKAIENARKYMGDMKLKMSPDYKVPPEKKLTTHRARKRLVILEEMMHSIQESFNRQMRDLRTQKLNHISKIEQCIQMLMKYRFMLDSQTIGAIPEYKKMTKEEDPGCFEKVSEEEIRMFREKQKKRQQSVQQTALQIPQTLGKTPSFTGRKKGEQTGKKMKARKSISATPEKKLEVERTVKEDGGMDLGSYVQHIKAKPTALEVYLKEAELTKAKFYYDYYCKCIEKEKFNFDIKLKLLYHKRLKVGYFMKIAEERMNLLIEEFILAQNSEAMEASILVKIEKAIKEKKECMVEMKGLTKKLDGVKKELESVAKQRAALMNEVIVIAKDAPTFEKYLIRVFKKKIAKHAKKETDSDDEEEGSEGSDDDSDDEDFDLEEEDEDDDGYDVDFPPPELNKDTYEAVVEVRTRRLIVDDIEEKARSSYDELTSAINHLKSRIAAAEYASDTSKRELNRFIAEMQQKQNNFDTAVSINLHQMHWPEAERNLEAALVTDVPTIEKLRRRIPELHVEKAEQIKKVQETKKMFINLNKEKKRFFLRLEQMNLKCDQEMLKKFGAITDISTLESFQTAPEILYLRADLQDLRNQCYKDIDALRTQIDRQIFRNTNELKQESIKKCVLAELHAERGAMMSSMEACVMKNPHDVETLAQKEEMRLLRKLVLEQWRTIHALNLDITKLTRRQASPLPPITPRKPTTDSSPDL